jgi:hypothetical protein
MFNICTNGETPKKRFKLNGLRSSMFRNVPKLNSQMLNLDHAPTIYKTTSCHMWTIRVDNLDNKPIAHGWFRKYNNLDLWSFLLDICFLIYNLQLPPQHFPALLQPYPRREKLNPLISFFALSDWSGVTLEQRYLHDNLQKLLSLC